MKAIHAVDLFCGAGGVSAGIIKAVRERMRGQVNLTAVNHWDTAINTHSLNHPFVDHILSPVENLHPREVLRRMRVSYLHLLAASCECTFHSNARGGGPCNEQSRSQPWQIIRWATDVHVENILMENVREWMNWGPLHRQTKRPIKSRKGEYFRAFCNALINLGYALDFKVRVCADFGDPTSRPRLVLIARKSKPVVWPEPTHGPGRPEPWRCARRHVIDWSLKGRSLFGEDGKPRLCENTVRRIKAGFEMQGSKAEPFLALLRGTSPRHLDACSVSVDQPLPTITAGGNHFLLCEPFMITANHQDREGASAASRVHSLDKPMPTITSIQSHQLVEPFITAYHNGRDGERRNHSVDEPLPTQDTSNRFALVQPIIVTTDQTGGKGKYVRTVDEPLATIVSKSNMRLCEPVIIKYYGKGENAVSVDVPLPTVTTSDRFALVQPTQEGIQLGILTRFLQPHELAAAHSFPKDYKLTGNQRDQVKQIGNSVPVELAAAHAHAALS